MKCAILRVNAELAASVPDLPKFGFEVGTITEDPVRGVLHVAISHPDLPEACANEPGLFVDAHFCAEWDAGASVVRLDRFEILAA